MGPPGRVYSDAAVASGLNGLQTDADEVLGLAAQGTVTAPGGLPMGSANIIINCPALAFLDEPAGAATAVVPTAVNAGSGGQASDEGAFPVLLTVLLLAGAGLAVVAGQRLVRR